MNTNEIQTKRSLLYYTKIRYSPQSQPLRDTIVDRIIERNILLMDNGSGVSLKQIENQVMSCFDNSLIINLTEIEKSIQKLIKNERIIKIDNKRQAKYSLDEKIRDELWNEHKTNENRIEEIILKLFKNKNVNYNKYCDAFLDILCHIFSKLGETYVKIIKGDATPDEFLSQSSVLDSLSLISNKYSKIDTSPLKSLLFTFFQEINPEFDYLKWNLAQNYFLLKILGIDGEGRLLSKEIFDDSTFYLDTNVLIPALEPKAKHHQSFKTLCNAFKQLNIKLKVCNISIEELKNVVEDRRRTIEKVADKIPEEISWKIPDIFYQLYLEESEKTKEINFDKLFSSFDFPVEYLTENYGVELIDDNWFLEAVKDEETKQISNLMLYEHQSKRKRPKRKAAAIHDTLLLRWISLIRKNTSTDIWLVTLDTSLPGFQINSFDSNERPIAITLDALLQWISPITINGDSEEKIASIFSEALKFQLLPLENLFDIKDFLVFDEIKLSCKELPIEDLQDCINYIRNKAPSLDPSDPKDREILAHEISKFFVDPGRKYKQNIEHLEKKIIEIEKKHELQLSKIKQEHEKQISEIKQEFKKYEFEWKDMKKKEEVTKLRRSAKIRLFISFLVFSLVESFMIVIAFKYGEGGNIFKRVGDLLFLPILGFSLSLVAAWFIIGKERINSLGWPFDKIFKNE